MVRWVRKLMSRLKRKGQKMYRRASYNPLDVASWIIQRNDQAKMLEDGDDLSLLKLIKLLYYAEGCSLASGNGSLFDEAILAWEHGPVIKSVWDKYTNAENKYNITSTDDDILAADKIAERDSNVLEGVYNTFGVYSAWGLRNKTHEEEPWLITTNGGQDMSGTIDRGLIKDYFEKHYVA